MKKSLFVAAFAALAVVACKKTENVETTNVDMDSTTAIMPADSTMNMTDSTTVQMDSAATTTTVVEPSTTTTTTETAPATTPAK